MLQALASAVMMSRNYTHVSFLSNIIQLNFYTSRNQQYNLFPAKKNIQFWKLQHQLPSQCNKCI